MITPAALKRYEKLLQSGTPPTRHDLDILVECAVCSARVGRECKGLPRGVVHFCRRLRRVLDGLRTDSEMQEGSENR